MKNKIINIKKKNAIYKYIYEKKIYEKKSKKKNINLKKKKR